MQGCLCALQVFCRSGMWPAALSLINALKASGEDLLHFAEERFGFMAGRLFGSRWKDGQACECCS